MKSGREDSSFMEIGFHIFTGKYQKNVSGIKTDSTRCESSVSHCGGERWCFFREVSVGHQGNLISRLWNYTQT